ncbi:MAG: DUF2089 family protein [Planctomycetes bacterium]|nr:DUF2089 family protein [Planctomycetota bacterium]
MAFDSSNSKHVLASLPPEDLDFITELVLRSGSLKEVAESYGVSYPTIRLRLDRIIERLKLALDGRTPDALSVLLAQMVERGELAPSAARSIRDTARKVAATDSEV